MFDLLFSFIIRSQCFFILSYILLFFPFLFYLTIIWFYCMTMFLCEALWVCLVYEKCVINKVALPCLYILFYQVSNPGQEVQTLGSAFLNIMWPYELANGKWLLYPASLRFENHPDTRCTPTGAIDPLRLSDSRRVGGAAVCSFGITPVVKEDDYPTCPLHPSVRGQREACLRGDTPSVEFDPHNAIWLADGSVTELTTRTDPQCIWGSPRAKSMRSVDGLQFQLRFQCYIIARRHVCVFFCDCFPKCCFFKSPLHFMVLL